MIISSVRQRSTTALIQSEVLITYLELDRLFITTLVLFINEFFQDYVLMTISVVFIYYHYFTVSYSSCQYYLL